MHCFSLHTEHDRHIGFFVMTPDNEHEQPPQSGRFLVKLQSETPPDAAAVRVLTPFCDSSRAGIWRLQGERVELYTGEGTPAGRIRNEYLTISGQTFILNDLDGVF
ncbi:Uncharacterised protein [Kingella potus]|uniref:Uncharacterized protein n=1 Tax=Kingella potus TaxID=265175 RepID=A0A377R322_9NEIS|nr:hypothetical protein [Kingella potus]UOP00249.1 hypothetical protein LVJ84_10005 [Kingella potus]STR02693.1 Uncharacterised protein [Kingella potus]